jgi:hypothetical protein
MFQFQEHAALAEMRIAKHVLRRVHRPERYAPAQPLDQLGLGQLFAARCDRAVDLVRRLQPRLIGRESRVCGELLKIEGRAQLAPECVGRTGDSDPAVTRRNEPERAQ